MALTIVIIDDNEDYLDIVSRLIERGGDKVYVAKTGAEGISAVAAHAPDMVLLDIRLPDMDGGFVARVIRRIAPRVRIVGASGWDRATKEIPEWFDEYIAKPFPVGAIAAALRRCTP